MQPGAVWLAFSPVYRTPRNAEPLVGAHAFRDGRNRSLCGRVDRSRAGAAADSSARRCTWCQRIVDGVASDRSEAAP